MKKKFISLLLVLTMVLGLGVTATAASADTPILALGADLSADQRSTVLSLMGISESDLSDYDVIYVTNAEEHEYLDSYLSSSVIGTKALSSVLIRPKAEGSGLNVSTYNISYCTIDMYTNALLTAGLEDAEVIVAAPASISGTSALIGAVRGYADMTDTEVDEEALETAVNELVVTGELGEVLDDSELASDIVAYVKQQIAEEDIDDVDDIEALIRQAMEVFDVSLTDDEVSKLVDLMTKISEMDIDVDKLATQAASIYDKLKDMGLDLENIDREEVGNFITRAINAVLDFLRNLFN